MVSRVWESRVWRVGLVLGLVALGACGAETGGGRQASPPASARPGSAEPAPIAVPVTPVERADPVPAPRSTAPVR